MTLEEMRKLVEGYGEEAHLYVFEKDDAKVAMCLTLLGAFGVNKFDIYSFDKTRGQWFERVYWDTEVRGVTVAFDKRTEVIEAHSGSGRLIFQANLAAFAGNRLEKLPLGEPAVEYPSVRAFQELETAVKSDGGGRLHRFEKGDVKVAVRQQPRGAGGTRVILYTWDEIGDQWGSPVIWDTGERDVRVTFGKSSGMIEVHSGDGKLIFRANILALKARPSSLD
jgi:hypothetical protein